MHREKLAELVQRVGPALRSLAQENRQLKEKVAQLEKKERIVKLASLMEEKNLNLGTTREEKVAQLEQAPDLDVVERAISLAGTQVKFAELEGSGFNASNAATSSEAFEYALLGGND